VPLHVADHVPAGQLYFVYTSGSQPVGRDPKVGRGGVAVGSRTAASMVCSRLEFLELRTSTFCYINKTETRTDLCEIHIIAIIYNPS